MGEKGGGTEYTHLSKCKKHKRGKKKTKLYLLGIFLIKPCYKKSRGPGAQ
jgi:hypothetical protein